MSVIKMTDLDLAGKRVLIRQDLNVPIKDGKVASDKRIRASMPTIEHCLRAGAKVMLMSHLGRPTEGEYDEQFSMAPVAQYLSTALGKDVTVVEMASDLSNLRASSGAVAMEFMNLISELNIPIHFNCKLEEVTDKSIVCNKTSTSGKIEFPADTVLLALGMSPRHDVADSLRHSAPETEVFVVGDAIGAGNIGPAVMSAFRAAAYI